MTPKEQVLKEYSGAFAFKATQHIYVVWTNLPIAAKVIGRGATEQSAWADAAGKLKTDKSITHATSN